MKIKKIYILGTSGSGKSYLARLVSEKLKIPFYDLDDVFWVKKYTEKLDEDKRLKKLSKIVKNKSWVIEGVYTSWVREAIEAADLIIWLKTPFYKRVSRIIKRKLNNSSSDTWKGTFGLVKFSLMYKIRRKKSSYSSHNKLLKDFGKKHIVIKNKKDFYKFLEGLK